MIDLQPAFQRGEVWSLSKKQRLIDSILRRWHIPPVHLVSKPDGKLDVLDGQQRLTAIRDYMRGDFVTDGSIEPHDSIIRSLGGLKFYQLPEVIRNQFELFAIRVFELRDYTPAEPHELFFRLNQPTVLTEAEKRNAFMGGPRNQIKDIVEWAVDQGMSPRTIGFSNARMNYDDLLARFLITLEQQTLHEKVTAARITDRYRRDVPFSDKIITTAKAALDMLLKNAFAERSDLKPNKATVYTWLCMGAKLFKHGLLDVCSDQLSATVRLIEESRSDRGAMSAEDPDARPLLVFHDRATSRVADTASVMLRDLVAWMMLARLYPTIVSEAKFLEDASEAWVTTKVSSNFEKALSGWATVTDWGGRQWL
jgi:hypothetical protein